MDKNPTKLPKYCIAAGFDYGDARRLPKGLYDVPLNQIETSTVSYQRGYGSFIKLKPSLQPHTSSEGHVIHFSHDAPDAATAALSTSVPNLSALDMINIVFMGTRDELEVSRKAGVISLVPLSINADKVYKYLRLLKGVNNPHYDSCILLDSPAIRAALESTKDRLLTNAIFCSDEKSLRLDSMMTSRIDKTLNLDQADESAMTVEANVPAAYTSTTVADIDNVTAATFAATTTSSPDSLPTFLPALAKPASMCPLPSLPPLLLHKPAADTSSTTPPLAELTYDAGGAVCLNNLSIDHLPGTTSSILATNADSLRCLYEDVFSDCTHASPLVEQPAPTTTAAISATLPAIQRIPVVTHRTTDEPTCEFTENDKL